MRRHLGRLIFVRTGLFSGYWLLCLLQYYLYLVGIAAVVVWFENLKACPAFQDFAKPYPEA